MPQIEVDLPDRVETEINRLVEKGEFVNREQAIEELLTMGASAYDAGESGSRESVEPGGDWQTQSVEDQGDPAARDEDADDERTF